MPGRQAEVVHEATEGGEEPALGIGIEMPVTGSSGGGVAGGAADRHGGGAGSTEVQVDASAVKIAAAVELVGRYFSDGGFSLGSVVGGVSGRLVD